MIQWIKDKLDLYIKRTIHNDDIFYDTYNRVKKLEYEIQCLKDPSFKERSDKAFKKHIEEYCGY